MFLYPYLVDSANKVLRLCFEQIRGRLSRFEWLDEDATGAAKKSLHSLVLNSAVEKIPFDYKCQFKL